MLDAIDGLYISKGEACEPEGCVCGDGSERGVESAELLLYFRLYEHGRPSLRGQRWSV